MKRHVKIYLSHFNLISNGYIPDEQPYIPCEVCHAQATDIHHIERRGVGGKNKKADTVENLMALCRTCHVLYGDKKHFLSFLKQKHRERLCQNISLRP